MTDLQVLYLTFVLLLLVEGILWLPLTSVLFVTYPWTGRIRSGSRQLRGERGQVILADPWPGVAQPFVCHFPAIWYSPNFIIRASRASSNVTISEAEAVPIDQIVSARAASETVYINDRPFVNTDTSGLATFEADLIQRLRQQDRNGRETLIRQHVKGMFDEAEIRRTVDAVRSHCRVLAFLCPALLVWILLIVPLVGFFSPVEIAVPISLAGFIMIVLAIAVDSHRLYARQGTIGRWPKIGYVVRILLYPPAALRAADPITIPALARFHPLGVAGALCDRSDFVSFGSRLLRQLTFPLPFENPAPSTAFSAEVSWYRTLLQEVTTDCLKAKGMEISSCLILGLRQDERATSYCPRCLSVFYQIDGDCPDCQGIRLRPIPGGAAKGTSGGPVANK